MLFERPEIIKKVYEVLKQFSVKFSAFLVNIQTLSVAAQSFLLQPLPKHPKSFFWPFENNYHPRQKFVYRLIQLSA